MLYNSYFFLFIGLLLISIVAYSAFKKRPAVISPFFTVAFFFVFISLRLTRPLFMNPSNLELFTLLLYLAFFAFLFWRYFSKRIYTVINVNETDLSEVLLDFVKKNDLKLSKLASRFMISNNNDIDLIEIDHTSILNVAYIKIINKANMATFHQLIQFIKGREVQFAGYFHLALGIIAVFISTTNLF